MADELSKCPFCGCDEEKSYRREGNPLYAHWSCGSYTFGKAPQQSDACRINAPKPPGLCDALRAAVDGYTEPEQEGDEK